MNRIAIFYLLAAAFFWGLNFHLAKVILASVGFMEAGFWRYAFGVGFLFVIQARYIKTITWSLFRKNSKGLLLVGVIGLFAFNVLFFLGLQYTQALNAALIISLNPILTLLFSAWLLRYKVAAQQWIGIAFALAGIFFLLSKGNVSELLSIEWSKGDFIILLANTIFALQNVWVKMYTKAISVASFTLITNTICLLGFVLYLPFISVQGLTITAGSFWLSVVGIGILGTSLAYLFWNRGVAMIGPGRAGVFMNMVPLSAGVLAVFFGESLHSYHLISGAMIIVGMLIIQRQR